MKTMFVIDFKYLIKNRVVIQPFCNIQNSKGGNMQMKVLHYYAKINENDICYGFETLTKKLKQEELPSNLVPLQDYNESVLWKKWDRSLKAWSSEAMNLH